MSIPSISELTFHHQLSIQTRFSDIDPLGHVNNSILFQYFDCGRVEYLQEVLKLGHTWTDIPFVVVNTNTDFLRPILFQEKVIVETKTLSFGTKSMKMVQRLISQKDGEIKSVCHAVLSGFDPKNNQAIVIPDSTKQAFLSFENR